MSSKTDTKPTLDIEKGWENPFPPEHPLHDLFEYRVRNKQDLVLLIDDWHARRGTGKTIASLQLAQGMNQNGWLTWEHVTMEPEEIRNAYSSLPERSALVFDEGERAASKYEANTNTNKALREIVSMGRVEEKYVIINCPDVYQIDKDLRKMADVWITMMAKGIGLVHYMERNPYSKSGTILTPKKGVIQFRDVKKRTPLRKLYNKLTREKKKHIRGEGESGYISKREHNEKMERIERKTKKKVRDDIITAMYQHPEHEDVIYRTIGECVDMEPQSVGEIIRSHDE